MSDNSIAILQAAEAYRKQLQVRNKWLEAERELRKKLDLAHEEINQANKVLEVASNNLSTQAGGYAPSTGQAKASSMAQTIAAEFNQDDVRPVRGN